MVDLSILIPARNEMFLARTIQDILENSRADTEIIAVLDGQWAEPAIADHERVTLIYHAESIGQRAATNEAARLARGKFVMKVDAHCAFAPGFDAQLLADIQDDWTMVPVMRNLHAFDWVCPAGHRRYQGPSGPCHVCGQPTEMDVVWISKTNPQSKSYRFDTALHFQYWGGYLSRPEAAGDLTESMSLQGSCFILTKERYWALNICDENFGSWGQQGAEVALKTWLSGGRVMVDHKTWYSHMFRTSGGDFGFPYPLSGKQVDHARKYCQDLFLNNKWEGQIRPLSWLIEKFSPIPDWHEESGRDVLARILSAGAAFGVSDSSLSKMGSVVIPLADFTGSHPLSCSGNNDGIREGMATRAMSLESVDCSRRPRTLEVDLVRDKIEMEGIAAPAVSAGMIEHRNIAPASIGNWTNQPGIDQSMDKQVGFIQGGATVPVSPRASLPNSFIIPQITKGIVYYTDNQLDEEILKACQYQLLKIGLPVVSVGLQAMPWFGRNITLELERGYLTMFKQILTGLEASREEVIFFCEHDVLYHPSHFDFIPPKTDVFFYNVNMWKVDFQSGRALHYDCQQTSGLCAYRDILIKHYRARVAHTEEAAERHGENTRAFRDWIRGQGFEPGTHHRAERVDDLRAESWCSQYPNIDIRHNSNLTPSRWRREEFRNQRYTEGWTEAEEVPGWGRTLGKFEELIEGVYDR